MKVMNAKASTIDGNIGALASLLEQSRIMDSQIFKEYMVLIHGDLGALGKINSTL